jgi:hypothetical protein
MIGLRIFLLKKIKYFLSYRFRPVLKQLVSFKVWDNLLALLINANITYYYRGQDEI